jgi:type IX secretion system PorP/SprF family membrane protein
MKKLTILLLTLLLATTAVKAQLGTPLSQFSGNQMLYNPAYAGVYEILTLNLSMRQQWTGILDAPRIINFNGHLPLQKDRHALGFIYTREELGPLASNHVYGNYTYKVYTGEGVLNLGFQAGIVNNGVDWHKFTEDGVDDWTDPALFAPSSTKFDMNVGLFYLNPNYYFGISARHITRPEFGSTVKIDEQIWYSRMTTHWFLIAGYHYDFDDVWSIRPELLIRYAHNTPFSTDIGAHLYFTNDYSLGVKYRTGMKALSFVAKSMFFNHFRFGYSYDIYLGPIKQLQSGSHEIMINYYIKDIWRDKKWEKERRMLWH